MAFDGRIFAALAGVAAMGSTAVADTLPTHRIPAALAVEAASETVAACAKQGYHETAQVVDADGVIIATIRGDGVGAHSLDSALDKAYTAASFKNDTLALAERAKGEDSIAPLAKLPHVMFFGGGVVDQARRRDDRRDRRRRRSGRQTGRRLRARRPGEDQGSSAVERRAAASKSAASRVCLQWTKNAALRGRRGPCFRCLWHRRRLAQRSGAGSDAASLLATRPDADPAAFADAWRRRYSPAMEEVRSGRRPFARLDVLHRENLEAVAAGIRDRSRHGPAFRAGCAEPRLASA